MQLTTKLYKDWADNFGFNNQAKAGEYDGGRWNPDSNIRAAARALAEKAKAVGADPTNSGTIWAAVAAYNGGGSAATYSAKVKKAFDSTYGPAATSAVTQAPKTTPGSAQRVFKNSSGQTVVALPDNTPDSVAKAVTWCMSKQGDPYQWGGAGNPGYDCSSFVTEALVIGDGSLRRVLDAPNAATGHHGDTTFTLWDKGTPVPKTNLLPGDLVFFDSITHTGETEPRGHVGMFLGGGQFIHDPQTGETVKISSLNDDYFRTRYDGARRFLNWNVNPNG
jgi:cell wall-associated NlpC family hydrolase